MKRLLFSALLSVLCLSTAVAQTFVNLTPKPKQMTVGTGELVLPRAFAVSYAGLPDSLAAEAERFVADFNAATGYEATVVASGDALITMSLKETAPEGYSLTVGEKVSIEAATARGFFYAFQSIKKMLPGNVMAGVADPRVEKYALPCVTINDEPRFAYRGFMLDVARHFFTVEEVKRMIDIMAAYKMNYFHWHLSDDQGWRVEIKKYPKLTTVGATADNCYATSLEYGPYWTNAQYGPFFYTQDELREVVAYAQARHIEVIPEFDMPGHFVAALVAYPEFSCNPSAGRKVWTNGGISADVLNVANPAAVQFVKDIWTELLDIFPGQYVHIGGDECPTSAWEGNAMCQARYQELGLTSYRQLQSHFIKEMADFFKQHGRRTCVWNEAITAGGADTKLMQEAGVYVWAWSYPASDGAKRAAQLGLDNVYTPWGPYYINRRQSMDECEATLAGAGTDNLQATYNEVPVPSSGISTAQKAHYTGVQGTFWTEHVADRELMEYLALPRLMAIAETGWTPAARKNFNDFCQRITADTVMLNLRGYNYGKHYIGHGSASSDNEKVMPKSSTATEKFWYRIVTRATDDTRVGRCIELLAEGSPLISEYSAKGAAAGVLWTAPQAAETEAAYDYQFWAFEEDPAHPGNYALVCKALPEGSVNPSPTTTGTGGRWKYDNGAKHYNFLLGENGYGQNSDGNTYYYSIRSSKTNGWYLNASMSGQGLAVNMYSDPGSGSGGHWSAMPMGGAAGAEDVVALVNDAKALLNNIKTYEGSNKVLGCFGATEAETLKNLIATADPASMTAEELAAFSASFAEAYAALRQSFGYMEEGATYRISNAVEGFENTAFVDNGKGSHLQHSADLWADDAWEVTKSTINADYSQTVKLKNKSTGRFVGSAAGSTTGQVAYPVSVNASGGNLVCTFNSTTGDYTLVSGEKNLYPVPHTSASLPGIISSGSSINGRNATRVVGAAWNIASVHVVTYVCVDEQGNELGTYRTSATAGAAYEVVAPEIKNHKPVAYGENSEAEAPTVDALTSDMTLRVVYRRSAYSVTLVSRDTRGALISQQEAACPVGESYTAQYPEHDFYTFASSDWEGSATFVPESDMTITATYETEAWSGVRELGPVVTQLQSGRSYVLYDTSPNATERIGYRNVNPTTLQIMQAGNIVDTDPYHVWTFEKNGTKFKVKNEYTGLYIPKLTQSGKIILSKSGDSFTFTLNADGETWKVQGTNGQYWDGVAGSMTGWHTYGHPYKVFEYYAQPYFTVTVRSLDTDENELGSTTALVKAGEGYTLVAPSYEGYTLEKIEGAEQTNAVASHVTVTVVYKKEVPEGIALPTMGEKANVIYDLSGRRLQRIAGAGIYIIDGRKIYINR